MDSEKRKNPRLEANYIANYRTSESSDQGYRMVTLKNISAGGALFTTAERLNVSTDVDMELNIPGSKRTPLTAVVVRANQVHRMNLNLYEIAVKFNVKGAYQSSINYLDNLIKKRLAY